MLAYTGLETVANLAEEARRPGVDLPRSVFGGIATVVTISSLISLVAVAGVPRPADASSARAGCARRSSASPPRIGEHLPRWLGDVLRGYVGVTGALILLAAVDDVDLRLLAARLLARRARPAAARLRPPQPAHARLPAGDRLGGGRSRPRSSRHLVLHARRHVPREPLLVRRAARVHRGQLAVIKLRVDEPDLPRPYRAPFSIPIGGPRSRCPRSSARR